MIEVTAKRRWMIEKVVFAQFDVCGRFSQVELTDLRCPQFSIFGWSHFEEGTAYV